MVIKRLAKSPKWRGKKPEHRWSPMIWIKDDDGGRHQLWGGTFRTKAEAQAEERRLLQERDKGIDLKPNKVTVSEILAQYIDQKRTKLKASSLVRSQELVNLLVPIIGSVQVGRLHPSDVSGAYNTLLERLAKRTVRHCHWQLHGALELAFKWGQVAVNVASKVDPPEPDAFEGRALTKDELVRLLDAMRSTPLAPLVLLAVDSGAREGELLALRWSDIDLEGGLVHITRSVRRMREGFVYSEPKTKRSRRTVEIAAATVAVLKAHRQGQLQQRLRSGELWSDLDLVFCTDVGGSLDGSTMSKAFRKTVLEAGLGTLRFHDVRHSSLSMLLKSGEPMADISRRAGHSTIGVTVDTYGHQLGVGGTMAATMGTILAQAVKDPTRWLANG